MPIFIVALMQETGSEEKPRLAAAQKAAADAARQAADATSEAARKAAATSSEAKDFVAAVAQEMLKTSPFGKASQGAASGAEDKNKESSATDGAPILAQRIATAPPTSNSNDQCTASEHSKCLSSSGPCLLAATCRLMSGLQVSDRHPPLAQAAAPATERATQTAAQALAQASRLQHLRGACWSLRGGSFLAQHHGRRAAAQVAMQAWAGEPTWWPACAARWRRRSCRWRICRAS